jgi:phospholipase/carboxylesterase
VSAERIVDVLRALERAFRDMDPPRIAELRRMVSEPLARLEAEPVAAALGEAAALAAHAAHLFADAAPPGEAILRFFAGSPRTRAQAALYALRREHAVVGRFFALPEWHDRLGELDPPTPDGVRVGLLETGASAGERGFAFYVPERYEPSRAWPLVVALHGGGGNGRDFVWTWLREARSRGCLLLAPSSQGSTWSFLGPDLDAVRLRALIAWLGERWRIDAGRMLLTGLSDGATYALCFGLSAGAPFRALAPGAGVFHPANLANGNLERARGMPVT